MSKILKRQSKPELVRKLGKVKEVKENPSPVSSVQKTRVLVDSRRFKEGKRRKESLVYGVKKNDRRVKGCFKRNLSASNFSCSPTLPYNSDCHSEIEF